MEKCFVTVLNMSLAASVVILVVMAARIFLRRAPKYCSYALWGIVLFRLLCPISFSADFSVYNLFGEVTVEQGRMEYFCYEEENSTEAGAMEEAQKQPEQNVTEGLAEGSTVVEGLKIVTLIWLTGILGLLWNGMISAYRLRQQLKSAVCEQGNIYRTNLSMPFVYGIFSPRIYLPFGIEGAEKAYILQHEQIHIRRGDYLIKAICNFVLWLHWFNPLVWVAFFLCEKDMEMSCDEAVIRQLGSGVKKEYAASLLALSVGERFAYSVPTAFGEGDVKGRIQNILHYKKPGKYFGGGVLALCVVLAIVLLANPSIGKDDKFAAAFEPPIKGIFWGMTPEEVAERLDIPKENISRGEFGNVTMVFENQKVFGQKGDVTLLFDMSHGEPGLLELWVSFEDLDREALRQSLEKMYGERIAANPDKWGSERVEELPQEMQDRMYFLKVEGPSKAISMSFSKETVWNSLKSQPLVTVTLGENSLSYNAQNMAGYLMIRDEERYKEFWKYENGITP